MGARTRSTGIDSDGTEDANHVHRTARDRRSAATCPVCAAIVTPARRRRSGREILPCPECQSMLVVDGLDGRARLRRGPADRGRLGRVTIPAPRGPRHDRDWPFSIRRSGTRRSSSSKRPGRAASPSGSSTSGPRSSTRRPSASISTSPWSARSRRSRATTPSLFLESLGRPGRQSRSASPGQLRGQVPDLAPSRPGRRARRPAFAMVFEPEQALGPSRTWADSRSSSSRRSDRGAGFWPRSTTRTPWRPSSSTRTSWERRRRRPSTSRSSSASPAATSGPSSPTARRSAPSTGSPPHWITNTARGGVARNCPVTADLARVCAGAPRTPSAGASGRRPLRDPARGLLVNEINHTMEFRNSEEPDRGQHLRRDLDHCLEQGARRRVVMAARPEIASPSSAAPATPAASCSGSCSSTRASGSSR